MRDIAATCVERSGGQGYLSCNRMSETIAFAHSGITAEGDNRVLMQKTAKEIMTQIQQGTYEWAQPTNKIFQNICDIDSLKDLIGLKETITIKELQDQTVKEMSEGKPIYDIWM